MWTSAFWLLGPPALTLLGFCLLWFQSWGRQYGSAMRWFHRSRLVSLLIGVILWGGIVATTVITMSLFALPLGILAAAIGPVVARRHWRSEVRFLVWTLAAAADRGMPLEAVARAFARDHRGIVGARASRLADYLDAAIPLPLALDRSRLASLFPEVWLAAAIGEKTGTLSQTLRKAIEQSTSLERAMNSIVERCVYLACIIGAIATVLVFYMIKVVPDMMPILRDFDVPLPRATQLLIDSSGVIARHWYLVPPLAVAIMVGLFVPLIHYLAPAFRVLPVVGRFFALVNEASVTQTLAVAVPQRQPVVESLELMASSAPPLPGRRRLARATKDIAGGTHWCEALQRAGLMSNAHAAVFQSAERAGNLAWALNEISDRMVHRAAFRARAVVYLGYPVLIGLMGVMVLYIAISLLFPLISIIGRLA